MRSQRNRFTIPTPADLVDPIMEEMYARRELARIDLIRLAIAIQQETINARRSLLRHPR